MQTCYKCKVCEARCHGNRDICFYQAITQDYFNDRDDNIKKTKTNMCTMCLGILQTETWEPILNKIKQEISHSGYDSEMFACALSFPNSILLREKAVTIFLQESDPSWNSGDIVPLKEAWKWCFGPVMAKYTGRTLESGAVCPFLINVHMEYEDETDELNTLKKMVPAIFTEREKCHKKFRGEAFTKKSIEDILNGLDPVRFKSHYPCPPKDPTSHCVCSDVTFSHNSIYLAGRYIKHSRELCQTPWILDGKKMMETSIQDIIFQPLVELYKISEDSVKDRLKFMSSGREDVDVRCLGDGRPFAIEIVNPTTTQFTEDRLDCIQKQMSIKSDLITVRHLQLVPREDLSILKKGEEFKSKQYVALCIKLKSRDDTRVNIENMTIQDIANCDNLLPLTDEDINIIKTKGKTSFCVKQTTPLRVLHRRPRLVRDKQILRMDVKPLKETGNIFEVYMETEAGTYVKEFVHGDFGRTVPNISTILDCPVDILALDVAAVNLDWPPKTITR